MHLSRIVAATIKHEEQSGYTTKNTIYFRKSNSFSSLNPWHNIYTTAKSSIFIFTHFNQYIIDQYTTSILTHITIEIVNFRLY